MSNRKKKATTSDRENDEVDELLRAAEEDIFLKMSLNSHTLRGSSSHIIPPDLDRRFQSLKSPKPHIPNPQQTPPIHTTPPHDDLLGRFEALKKTLPDYPNLGDGGGIGFDDGEEEDEVEKVIRWAMDEARLNPSLESDTEEEDQESDDDYDSEEDSVKKGNKGKGSKKK